MSPTTDHEGCSCIYTWTTKDSVEEHVQLLPFHIQTGPKKGFAQHAGIPRRCTLGWPHRLSDLESAEVERISSFPTIPLDPVGADKA